jgi:hypothetical protein
MEQFKDHIRKAVAAARLMAKTARASIWAVLLLAFPYSDQIMAAIDENLPALAAVLPKNAYAFVGAVIVGAKFALQIIKVLSIIKAARAAKAG